MTGKFIILIGFLTLSGSCMASITKYAYSPFIRSYAATPPSYFKSSPLVAAAPVIRAAPVVKTEEIDPHPQYEFAYDVYDSVTGDIKNQIESRDGDNVAGSYSVIDADGYKRTVSYTADDINGFNAVVQRDPILGKTVIAAAPIVAKGASVVEPTAFVQAAPIVKTYRAAPLVQANSLVQSYAPIVPAAPVVESYATSPVIHAAPYSTSPFARSSYLASGPVQQFHHLPGQQQLSYFSSPVVAVQQQNHQELEQQEVIEAQAQQETQQFTASQQPESVEYPKQEPEQQEQPQLDEQQQLAQEQQALFAQQQQQFAAQQQQVILQQQQLVEQQQQYFQQQQKQQQQQFLPYPQYEIPQNQLAHPEQNKDNDSEIVEARSSIPEKQRVRPTHEQSRKRAQFKSAVRNTAVPPAPVNEEPKESDDKNTNKANSA